MTKSHYLILFFHRFDIDGRISLYSGSHGNNIPNTVPVWSCIALDNLPNVIKKLNCRLDTTQYKELLDSHVLPFCDGLQIVHDYFPVHYASSVKEYIKSNALNVLPDWPRKSGDLMPLENVWREMVYRFEAEGIFANTVHELWTAIEQVFNVMNRGGYFIEVILDTRNKLRRLFENDGDWVAVN